MRVGVFGGTFDPIHTGHLIVAETASDELQLDRVLFVLSPFPPHKNSEELSPATTRLDMLRLATAGHPGFVPSTIELQRAGTCYTVDTLRELKALPEYNRAELYLLIGMDSLVSLQNWREPEAILQLVKLAVYPRTRARFEDAERRFQQATHLLQGPLVEISATAIRQRRKGGRSIRYLVPEEVWRYIETHELYR